MNQVLEMVKRGSSMHHANAATPTLEVARKKGRAVDPGFTVLLGEGPGSAADCRPARSLTFRGPILAFWAGETLVIPVHVHAKEWWSCYHIQHVGGQVMQVLPSLARWTRTHVQRGNDDHALSSEAEDGCDENLDVS